ncbi:MAG: right-handed parallel beta-helix repeat-containing protein [Pirellulaceae bacterium]
MRIAVYVRISALLIVLDAVMFAATASGADALADQLAVQIDMHVRQALPMATSPDASPSVVEYEPLAVTESWTEVWPDADGKEATRSVHGRIWNAPIQAALSKYGAVFLPHCDAPYYLNEPIVLKSGQRLSADPRAEIRLVPGVNTCMVRNEHLVASQEGPVPADTRPDTQIVVEGGIWTTLATSETQSNGNVVGRSARQGEVPSCHGVLLFNNLRGLLVRNITIRQSRAHGVQLSNCGDFLVDGVTFEDHRRDGVHVNGPASYGVIRNICGVTGDDVVALNAWDWRNTAPTFGPIHHVLVESIHGNPLRVSTDEIRLLPGTKTFAGGKLDCSIADCVLRDLHDIRTFKIYDQPNLELGRDNDFCDPIGTVRNVHFQKLIYNRPGPLQIAVNVEGLFVDDVQLNFDPHEPRYRDFRLVEIGPMSQAYKVDPSDTSTWVELFSPDLDVTVRNFRLTNVRANRGNGLVPLTDAESQLVRVADQKPNPDYPKTTPRGGTGKARLIP